MNSLLVIKFQLLFVIFFIGYRLSDQSPLDITIEGFYSYDISVTLSTPNDISTTPSTPNSGPCDKTAYPEICVQIGRKAYLIEGTEKKNWFDAERFCRRQNGYLANIENEDEMDLITEYLQTKNLGDDESRFYIGGNDLGSEGTFYTVGTGELMLFTRWLPGEPSNYDLAEGEEHCVHIWNVDGSYGMNDEPCSHKDHYMCELI